MSTSLVITLGTLSLGERPVLTAPQVPQFPFSYPDNSTEGVMERRNLGFPPDLHHCFHKYSLGCLQQSVSAGVFIESPITDHCVDPLFSMEYRTLSMLSMKTDPPKAVS